MTFYIFTYTCQRSFENEPERHNRTFTCKSTNLQQAYRLFTRHCAEGEEMDVEIKLIVSEPIETNPFLKKAGELIAQQIINKGKKQ